MNLPRDESKLQRQMNRALSSLELDQSTLSLLKQCDKTRTELMKPKTILQRAKSQQTLRPKLKNGNTFLEI